MEILYIAIVTFFAAGIGTLTGFGTSTIMVPLLILFLPLPQTLLLVGIIHIFGNIWKMLLFRGGLNWKILLAFGIPGIILSYIGARLSFNIDETFLMRLLGVFLIVFVSYLFFKPSFKLPKSTFSAATGGALSGFFAGIFGVGGAIRAAFLTAYDLPKSSYIFTSGAIAIIIDLARLATYTNQGTRLPSLFLYGLFLFIPISFIGAYTAKKVVNKIPQKKFRNVVGIFLLLIGIKFLLF